MRLYYVFGALLLLGFLQCTLAKMKGYKRYTRKESYNEKNCPISRKTDATALRSGLKIDCIGSYYITELNVTGNDGEVCATLYDQRIDKCMWQRACNLTVDVGDWCSEQLNVSYICRKRPKAVYYLSSRKRAHRMYFHRSGHVYSHYGYGDSWVAKTKLEERRLRLYRKDPEYFAFTIYRMNIGAEILTVVTKDALGKTRNFSFTGALTLSDDLSKRTHVIDDIKSQNITVSLSGLPINDTSSGFGICYKWMTLAPQQNKFDACKSISTTCLASSYYDAMKKYLAKRQEKLIAKLGTCHLTMGTTKTALQKSVTVDCISRDYNVVNLTVTEKNGKMCATLEDRRSGKIYCRFPSKCRVTAGLLKTCPEDLRINFACVSSVHADCLSNSTYARYTRKMAGIKESCSETFNTNKTNLQKGVLIRCYKSGLRELNVTGEGGKTCATLKDQPFQKCSLQNTCLLKANLATECSEQLKVSYVCNDYPKGILQLYNIAKSWNKLEKLKWVPHGQYHYHSAPEGFVQSDVAYGRRRMTSETHPPSNVTIQISHGTELQHFAFTVFSMNIGAEKLSVVAEDVNGITREFSFTGALTLSDDISKRTRVISDIKPRNVTVFLSGLQSEDNSLGFRLCYKWINWDSKMDEETFDTCQHFTRKCRYQTYFHQQMEKRKRYMALRKSG